MCNVVAFQGVKVPRYRTDHHNSRLFILVNAPDHSHPTKPTLTQTEACNYCPLHSQATVTFNFADIMPRTTSSHSYVLPFFARSTGSWKMRTSPFTWVGGVLPPVNRTLFSRSKNLSPTFTPSVQVMVRLFPSTTVTAPTGSMVTVWATDTPNTPKLRINHTGLTLARLMVRECTVKLTE